ncbi:glutamic acid-rich protein-like isoform X2 [Panicum virgatum]|nr:glutamic acid-rich protein-like isoform X2 [Panicum virgatum]XP_039784639.1 glutamic acid-rich protein-like isoform X2 [Panicum virgatum]XP_039784640.1 glutamic acid-rich protein-like isoform X2 [Panicum virgatum]XP_039784641.1 glutamic acid-rich protein-like isoform X2 [Panicum virgatum]
MTDDQREEKNRKRREVYHREKISAPSMTDEQREEKNRKRREAYKRKKSHALNKENDPGSTLLKGESDKNLTPLKPVDTNIEINKKMHNKKNDPVSALLKGESDKNQTPLKSVDTNIERNKNRQNKENDPGSDLFKGESNKLLTPLKSLDSNIERNKKGCEDYQKKNDETRSKSISAEPLAPIICTPIVIEPPTCLPFNDETVDVNLVNVVKPTLSDTCTDVPPVLCYQPSTACVDTPGVSVGSCKTKVLTDEQRAHRNKHHRELYHEKKQLTSPCDVDRRDSIKQRRREAYHAKKEAIQLSIDKSKSKKTRAQLSREYKRRQREFHENNLHPDSIAWKLRNLHLNSSCPLKVNPQ